MNDQEIKEKIIALLRLSKNNNNANEAGSAKRKAEALMARYNLKEIDLYPPQKIEIPGPSFEDLMKQYHSILTELRDVLKQEEEIQRIGDRNEKIAMAVTIVIGILMFGFSYFIK